MNALQPIEDVELDDDRSEAQKMLAELEARQSAETMSRRLPLELPVAVIKRHEVLFQPRAEVETHLSDLARVLQQGGIFDPLTILQIGRDPILVDGHHRHTAYARSGFEGPVPVNYFQGTVREAVIAAGVANHKAKLTMTGRQKQDRAWRLVVMGRFTKAQEREGSGVSNGQIGFMRKVAKALGASATQCESWGRAHKAYKDAGFTPMTDEERAEWLDEQAADYAKRLHKAFGSQLTGNVELAAMAFAHHFGDHLGALASALQRIAPEDETSADADEIEDF